MRILIVQTAFLGDVILATSLIETIHREFPDAELYFLLRKGNESLLINHPFLKEVLIWNKSEGKIKSLMGIISRVRSLKFDWLINLQRFFSSGLITTMSGAGRTVGYDKNPLSALFSHAYPHNLGNKEDQIFSHEIDRNARLLVPLVKVDTPEKPRLYPSITDLEVANSLKPKRRFITISPASVWFTKQFPAQKWIEFIEQIPLHFDIVLLGGPSDYDLCTQITQTIKSHQIYILAGKMSLLQTAALMTYSQMNFTNDSAPMHLASAMNAPVTAIFCSTIPQFGFGPLSDVSHTVQIHYDLYCQPCGLHGYKSCPEGHFRCAMEIKPLQLLSTLIPA